MHNKHTKQVPVLIDLNMLFICTTWTWYMLYRVVYFNSKNYIKKYRFLIKIDQNFDLSSKFQFLSKISIFDINFDFWRRFRFVTKILIFDQNFDFSPKFIFFGQYFDFSPKLLVFIKISSFDHNINFLSKISISDQNLDFWPKFRFLIKILIFFS